MPSRLVPSHPGFQAQQLAKARELTHLAGVAARGPFLGYVPDLPVHHVDMNAARDMQSLVARSFTSGGGEGEVLMLDSGWSRVTTSDPSTDMPINGGTNEIVHITQFPRTDPSGDASNDGSTEYEMTTIAILAGDGATENTCEMWRILPSTGGWVQILHTDFGPAATDRPAGDRDDLPDSCVLASGWPDRDTDAVFSGSTVNAIGIDEPCFVWTNGNDPVYIFPADSEVVGTLNDEFEDLTDAVGLDPFKAKSCEAFNNRIYFLNTTEAGTNFRQRLRRTPPFTSNPDPAQVGAGSSDLKDFAGDGLRAERLGNVLALYFEDGVAFMRPTQVRTAPDSFQTISTSRGLISTHAVCNTGNDLHFGIFTDGWFELDPSGRFREVGIANVGGVPHHKWKDTFYGLLGKDPAKRNRLYVEYHPVTNRVYISLPTDAEDENQRVWVYDRTAERVFLDTYPAVCWGRLNRDISTAGLTYGGSAPLTYSSIAPATYASVAAQAGHLSLVHGTTTGFVFQHDPDRITRDTETATGNTTPAYSYQTPYISGSSPRFLMTGDRVIVEYINLDSPNMNVQLSSKSASETQSVDINVGNSGEIHTGQGWFRITDQQLSLKLSGTGPVMIKSFEADIYEEQVEPR